MRVENYVEVWNPLGGETPFLTVVTKTFYRPRALAVCRASLEMQRDLDFEQVVLYDVVDVGIDGATAWLVEERRRFRGRYVYMLDDDMALAVEDFVGRLKGEAAEYGDPDVFMVRSEGLEYGILPHECVWGKEPQLGHIDQCNYVVRRDVFERHAEALKSTEYEYHDGQHCGDFAFIEAVFAGQPSVRWIDRVMVRLQRISRGAREEGAEGLTMAKKRMERVSYEGMYVKLRNDATFWAVDGWRRRAMHSMNEVMALGLRPVVTVSREVLEGIPVVVEAPTPDPSPEYRGGEEASIPDGEAPTPGPSPEYRGGEEDVKGEDVKGEGEG